MFKPVLFFERYKVSILAALAGIITFTAYLGCLYPVYAGNDSPETITACQKLWLQHPPGYPLYTMAGKIASYIPAANPGFRINLFAALLSAVTAAFFVIFASGAAGAPLASSFAGAMVLAFASTFWGQGIEAKGGIYILNGLLLLALLYCAASPDDKKKFYLACFITGLSLSHHYQSAVAVLPVIAFLFYRNRKRAFKGILFMLLGLTPFILLIIRGRVQAPPRWGDPSTLEGFLFIVLRKGYPPAGMQSMDTVLYQAAESLKQFYMNFSMLAVMIIPGIYMIFKKNRFLAVSLISTAVINVTFVLLFNNVPKSGLWFISRFILPSLIIAAVFITAGFSWLQKILMSYKKAAALLICAMPAALIFSNAGKNMMACDYLSYDLTQNVAMTMEEGSLYMAEGDCFAMPFTYEVNCSGNRKKFGFFSTAELEYDFGRDDFKKMTGIKLGYAMELKEKFAEIAAKRGLYTDLFAQKSASAYFDADRWHPRGILYKYGQNDPGAGFFRAYSYRSIFEKTYADFEAPIIYYYPGAMSMVYSEEIKSGKHDGADALIRLAGLFPGIEMVKWRGNK